MTLVKETLYHSLWHRPNFILNNFTIHYKIDMIYKYITPPIHFNGYNYLKYVQKYRVDKIIIIDIYNLTTFNCIVIIKF